MVRLGLWAAVAALAGGTILAVPAAATPRQTAWSTFMRGGPGAGYPVIDELEHGAAVDVRACANHWCEVQDGQLLGWIDQDAVDLPKPAPADAPPRKPAACFVANQDGYKAPTPLRFCWTTPRGASQNAAGAPPGP